MLKVYVDDSNVGIEPVCCNLEAENSVVPYHVQNPEVLEAYHAKPINLEALFTGGYPLEKTDGGTAAE